MMDGYEKHEESRGKKMNQYAFPTKERHSEPAAEEWTRLRVSNGGRHSEQTEYYEKG